MAIHYTQASAGAGKTHSIETKVSDLLVEGMVKPANIIVVTFTIKAADELKSRITNQLIKRGCPDLAVNLTEARIGTINSVCGRLLEEFAFELGLSPCQRVLEGEDKTNLIKEALDLTLEHSETEKITQLARSLNIEDWGQDVLTIIEKARLNNINTSSLIEFSNQSKKTLKGLLPGADVSFDEKGLKALLLETLKQVNQIPKPTKGLLREVEKIEKFLRKSRLGWQDWVKVWKFKAGVKENILFEEVKAYAGNVLSSPAFQADLFSMIENVFDAASRVMNCFAAMKAERGLVDFVDQEHLLLEALDNANVSGLLKEQIQWLVVDEFQDSSPLQLALFSKLSILSKDVLFVGDAKQAIYGFRDTDARLSLDVVRYVNSGNGTVSTLDHSWRSRPALVHFFNAIFSGPFSHLMSQEQIILKPAQVYTLPGTEVGSWVLNGGNQNSRARALASGMHGLIEEKTQLWDKESGRPREAQWKDMAILCRTGSEVSLTAGELVRMGIPVAVSQVGLLETPEAALALACLRRLVDPLDTLASAEIICLTRGQSPADWLDGRFEALKDKKGREWGDTACDALSEMAKERSKMGVLSPKEALITAMDAADIQQTVVSWGEEKRLTDHRLANLQYLVELTDTYQDHCQAHNSSGSVSGFILWLKDQERNLKDRQAENRGNAVSVLTYHGAKGLEWPVVICTSLDKNIQVSLFGINVIPSSTEFNWKDPLLGRSLRYWPNPFPEEKANDPLTQLMEKSDYWVEMEQVAIDEALRLLYVGMTRARDHLVLTSTEKAPVGNWLKTLNSPLFPLENGVINLPGNNELKVTKKILCAPDEAPSPPEKRILFWLPRHTGKSGDELSYSRPPSSEEPLEKASAEIVYDFGWRIPLNGKPAMDEVGNALHHALSIMLVKEDVNEGGVDRILQQYPGAQIEGPLLHKRGRELSGWIQKEYPEAVMHTEMPFSYHRENGQFSSGLVDIALELNDQWIVIDHKSNPQPKSEWESIALSYSGQLQAYVDALTHISGKPVGRCLIHFVLGGGLVSVF